MPASICRYMVILIQNMMSQHSVSSVHVCFKRWSVICVCVTFVICVCVSQGAWLLKEGRDHVHLWLERAVVKSCWWRELVQREPVRAVERSPCGIQMTRPPLPASLIPAEILLMGTSLQNWPSFSWAWPALTKLVLPLHLGSSIQASWPVLTNSSHPFSLCAVTLSASSQLLLCLVSCSAL